jgi:hypothetical protein
MDYKKVFELAENKGYPFFQVKKKMNFKSYKDNPVWILFELTLIQKWLREEHNIAVEVRWFEGYTAVYKRMDIQNMSREELPRRQTYEEALLEGVEKALQLI